MKNAAGVWQPFVTDIASTSDGGGEITAHR